MGNKYDEILEQSKAIDDYFKKVSIDELREFKMSFGVPKNHPRTSMLEEYGYDVRRVGFSDFESATIISDSIFKSYLENLKLSSSIIYIDADEGNTKEISFLDEFIEKNKRSIKSKLVVLGGNLILNTGAYVAEKLNVDDLVYIPTTVISMSDGSMGGKVRVNKIDGNVFTKHFYKSYYEPNGIIVDPYFLELLSPGQINVGLSEIVKHGIYQSKELMNYLASDDFNPVENRESLSKAILWTANLKKVCLDVDPDESAEGAYIILRGAHDLSDRIEEESHFTIPHGEAVSIAMWDELQSKNIINDTASLIYKKFNLRKK